MFYYDGNSEGFEELVEEYMATDKSAGGDGLKIDYRLGKGWPNFTLADMEAASGLDGEEYGFNPNKANVESNTNLKAVMPEFLMAGINLGNEDKKGCAACNDEDYSHIHHHADILDTDIDYMRNLSGEISRRIRPVVDEVLNEYEYEGSPVMGDNIDREFLAQIVDKAIGKAVISIDEVEDIMLDDSRGSWDRQKLLRCVFETVILKEMFGCRRPNYRRIME